MKRALILAAGLFALPAQAAPISVARVAAPFGYIEFCVRHAADCKSVQQQNNVETNDWLTLVEVNEYVNRNTPQITDQDNYGRPDFWTYPNERGGDCEDFALEKRKLLIERGWPVADLSLAVVKQWNGDHHVILIATLSGNEVVLDNANWAIVALADAPYTLEKRQARTQQNVWVQP